MMVQTVLDVLVSPEESAIIKEEMHPTIKWSGEVVESRFVNHQTEEMEGVLR